VGSRQLRLSHSYTVSSNVINVANFTYSSYNNPSVAGAADGGWPQKLGFGDTGVGNFPEIDFGDAVNGIGTTAIGYNANSGYKGQTFILSDSLSWVKGKHMFKFGGEYRHMDNRSWPNTGVLSFDFNPQTTGVTGQPWSNQVGFGFASFLLGQVNDASQETPGDLHGRRSYLALFAQDDWRVNEKLTVNYGLRWETTGAWTEKNGHWANYDNTATNLQWVAFLTGGEGLHNNHHEYPTSARFAHRWMEIDPAWPVIHVLERLGLAKVKRLPFAKAA